MKVVTDHPFCKDSLDFLKPIGAINDNTTSLPYIEDLESHYGRKISYLELGCSGGQVVMDLTRRGHDAYGLEGTPFCHPDYRGPNAASREAWHNLYGVRLFNCDLSKDFSLEKDNGEVKKFDVISSWEVFEHLPTECLPNFMKILHRHLKDDGAILLGISPWGYTTDISKCDMDGVGDLGKIMETVFAVVDFPHQSCFFRSEWEELFFNELFVTSDYMLDSKLRSDGWDQPKDLRCGSFYCTLRKRLTNQIS